MKVRGITFVGTATNRRAEMTAFLENVLGLPRSALAGADADVFELPNGVTFAVAPERSLGETSRTIGFLVDDLDCALAEIRAAGIEPEHGIGENERFRYAHVVLPDGHLYELVEERRPV
jgi:glyoxylase I family protein